MDRRITTPIIERLTQASVDKIDLLLAIDNSRSMADKQAILAQAVPDLVEALVNRSQEVLDEVLAARPVTERRLIRFAGQGEPQAGATLSSRATSGVEPDRRCRRAAIGLAWSAFVRYPAPNSAG